jgi:hypothetical protein
MYFPTLGTTSAQTTLLHWFFFRCFILETVVLNGYIFLGLVGVLLLLVVRIGVEGGVSFFIGYGVHSTHRLRLVTKFRRQVRRGCASRVSYRFSG